MADKVLKTIRNVVGGPTNNGEALYILTAIVHNGDTEPEGNRSKSNLFLNQKIILNSYGNSAQLNLTGSVLDPSFLRKMADDIENELNILAITKDE